MTEPGDRDQIQKEAVESGLDSGFDIYSRPYVVRRPDGAKRKQIKPVALVTWEDITAYTRVEIPEDFEVYRLTKITVGILWKEGEDYLVLVQDYDLSNKGKGYRHNDFHIIPRGAVRDVEILGEVEL